MTFVKGVSGNPNGRPKGSGLNLTSLLKVKLEECPKGKKKTYAEMFLEKLMDKALVEGDTQSLKLIINYVDGLPKQDIGLSGDLIIKLQQYRDTDSPQLPSEGLPDATSNSS